jgi:hypothetical protein
MQYVEPSLFPPQFKVVAGERSLQSKKDRGEMDGDRMFSLHVIH